MKKAPPASWRVLLPVSLGTGLALLGDSSLYTVLATHLGQAGVTLASVGVLLSANRWVRLPLNAPAGLLFERWPRRALFVSALFSGAVSTAIYALTRGFWPLLIGRLLWGIAWVGIWVGGNTIVLDISQHTNRGRWVGIYQVSFFLGAGGGAVLGGLLTDRIGYHAAMGVIASLTLAGTVFALAFLPETRGLRSSPPAKKNQPDPPPPEEATRVQRGQLASATALMAVNRLTQAGFMAATLGLFLQQQLGDMVNVRGQSIGIATLTGVGLGMTTLFSTATTPLVGTLSDRTGNRWKVAAGGLLPGIAGYLLVGSGIPVAMFGGLVLVAIASGSNMNLSTALIGDLSRKGQHGRQLGLLFTIGDLASALGPPLAFTLMPSIQLRGVYWFAAALFGAMALVSVHWARRTSARLPSPA